MRVVAQWITHIMLHMPDQHIMPIHYIKGAIRSKFHINRTEIPVF